ncbi:DUF4844 domain-containing protein [Lysobacter capsici]|uniref:DUF4844 domain-containing protein n=1 Tax=Lysobacter capsici TaxID=435897 RepID=UPI0017816C5D|nr:DUF4844 domain-containing protein [Lysobacter capsici]UOF14843.1 DUF4844 domain-containing protein [Lysobacter capsici]
MELTQEGTAMPHQAAAECLSRLMGQDHFAGDPATIYTGVQDPRERLAMNARFDRALAALRDAARDGATPRICLDLIDRHLAGFVRVELDTEDAERVAECFEMAMDCLGIESSEGMLNRWLYGFDP